MTYTLLDAYLCRNLGDDLMVLELCRARSNEHFTAPDLPGGLGTSLAGIGNLAPGAGLSWARSAIRADGYVMCGGSMFIDRRGMPMTDRARFVRRWGRRLAVALLMRFRRRSVEVIGCNIGPIETVWGKVFFGAFLRLTTRVTVRDTPSAEAARHLGARRVQKAPDMVLSYLRDVERTNDVLATGEVIGVSVMEWPGVGVEQTLKQYVAIGRHLLLARPDAEIRLFGFQDQFERDDLLVGRIREELEVLGKVADCSYHGDAQEVLAMYGGCTRVVATRFHSAILALGLGIPFVQVSYSKKIINFLNDIGWDGEWWDAGPDLGESCGQELVDALRSAQAITFLPGAAALHAWEH